MVMKENINHPNRKYTWKRQHPDSRDFDLKSLKLAAPQKLPVAVNLRKWCSEVEDQGELGSCTAHAWAGILQYNENKYKTISPYRDLSRLFIYYNERKIEGTINDDSGAELRDGAKAIATYGVCDEKEWPYKINCFKNQPSSVIYKESLKNKINNYHAINSFNDLKVCLSQGNPFVFGFDVYESFESDLVANTGVVQMPKKDERLLGGHAVMAIGYDDTQSRFLVRNSWGKFWGLKGNLRGYFTIPYAYLANSNLASDFWTVIQDV